MVKVVETLAGMQQSLTKVQRLAAPRLLLLPWPHKGKHQEKLSQKMLSNLPTQNVTAVERLSPYDGSLQIKLLFDPLVFRQP